MSRSVGDWRTLENRWRIIEGSKGKDTQVSSAQESVTVLGSER